MAKKIAVIGSGASGLAAIKCCLDENLEPVCFERTTDIGGLWRYTKEIDERRACVMQSTVINTSKEMMCYSDFPIPKEYAIFMHNSQVLKYFNLYADAFNLRKYIQFETEIVSVKKASEFDKTGQWDIEVKELKSRKTETHVFDGVLVCTGHHATKNVPTFEGLETFKGKVLHSHEYRDFHGFENERILVVGIGNSGGDAAVELSRIASQVFLSTRRGSWVMNRVQNNGMPADMLGSTKFFHWILRKFPKIAIETIVKKKINSRFDHSVYSIKPKHGVFAQHPTVNDDLPNRIISGSVKVKTNVKRFTERNVEFEDGTIEEDVDVVFLATGYKFGFPFMDKSIIDVKENRVELFKYVFPPDLPQQTLAFIGCIQPLGAIMPISELQCRLSTRVFKGDVKLPSADAMWKDIRSKEIHMVQRYVKSNRHTIQVDYAPFMDELAELNGCKVNLKELMKTDPKLALTCFFGPCTPYQYRLEGPGKWAKAKECILTQWDRTLYPLKTRTIKESPNSLMKTYIIITIFVLLFAYFFVL